MREHEQDVRVLVIGFGFSCIPLLRELDRSEVDYAIVSERDPVWKRLDDADRLDFDLVSSYHSSFYSFDLVKEPQGDRYPTAREFYQMQLRYLEEYEDRIISDRVELIENFADHSRVRTRDGRVFRAKFVVVSTGFARKMNSSLATFDYDIENKTVVFTCLGDSANLMISKLVPRNNRIVVISRGIAILEKSLHVSGADFTIDQFEWHNGSYLLPRFYYDALNVSFLLSVVRKAFPLEGTFLFRIVAVLGVLLAKIFHPKVFISKYPDTLPLRESDRTSFWDRLKVVPMPNAFIAIKHWSIEMYARSFGQDLPKAIQSGFLLNDLIYFIDQKLVEYYRPEQVFLDREEGTVTLRDGERIEYDRIVDGDRERPRLPRIVFQRDPDAAAEEYEYRYKDCYLGLVPKDLSNVFLLGYTRPLTGGLANITEMQSLLAHSLITDDDFRTDFYEKIEDRIAKYNVRHYHYHGHGPADHVVYFGTYTEDVARVLGINPRLRDCRSVKAVVKHLFFPNAAYTYRQKGKYRVEGCEELVEHVYQTHGGFAWIGAHVARFFAYHVLFATLFLRLYFEGAIGLVPMLLLIFAQYPLSPVVNLLAGFAPERVAVDVVRGTAMGVGILAVAIFGSELFLYVLGADVLVTVLLRLFKPQWCRYLFGDLKIKAGYHDFFARYKKTYNEVNPVGQSSTAEPRRAASG